MEHRTREAAEVDAALDAALETGPLDFEDDLAASPRDVGLDAGLGIDGDGDVDVDADDSILEPESTGTENSDDNIRVFVRVRPPNAREGSAPCRDIVRADAVKRTVQLLAEPPRVFAFDGVLSESSSQEEVFKLVGTSVGEACLSGYNGSIYVYGQTGSGKTYTMQGPVASVQSMHSNELRGVMCRILDLIFAEIGRRHREGGNVEYRCKCSYLEIYQEQITDLLEPGSTNLQVREDINRGIYVERLSEHSVWTVSDAFHVLWKGLHQRHVSATHMNDLSSRSHAVFTLVLEATSTTPGGVTSTRTGRLNLIDLAGSERQSFDPHNPTLHESLRVKEAGSINKSLSALTNVIMSLSRAGQRRRGSVTGNGGGNQRRPFVRYRDSKLTFLLRDSLGGNSKTVIVANVSPSALCFGETLSTLKFAARAKHIRCAAVMNEEYSGTVESLMLEVKNLKQQLTLLSSKGLIPGDIGTESQASFVGVSSSRSALGGDADGEDDPLEALIACGNDDLRRLYGPRRVRRLEILLAAALERERRCELRRHKLDKFTQYLDTLLEQKERYFDGLRDYFAHLVDTAIAESCYPPDVNAKLSMFRQQLCRVPTVRRNLESEVDEGGLAMLDEREESPLTTGDANVMRNNPSFGALSSAGEAVRRGGRRGTSQSMQQKSSSTKLIRGGLGDSPYSLSSSALVSSPTNGQFFPGDVNPEEEHIAILRTENKLLRRQVESHPELHRLAVENRLLREHLASLVQQHAMAREEPPWPKGHRHARRAHDGDQKTSNAKKNQPKSDGLHREPSLTRTSKSSFFDLHGGAKTPSDGPSLLKTTLGQVLKTIDGSPADPDEGNVEEASSKVANMALRPFPGIEEATQISPSDSSVESDAGDSDDYTGELDSSHGVLPADASLPLGSRGALGPTGLSPAAPPRPGGDLGGLPGTADASSFLPTMAREVEELLHLKGGLEDSMKQFIRNSRTNEDFADAGSGTPQRVRSVASFFANTEIEPRMASEILRGTSEALRFAEGMLSKGKGEPLLLSANGQDGQCSEGSGVGAGVSLRGNEGLDERDVFLSLMKCLPSEGPSLSRQGFASSAPNFSPVRSSSFGGEASGNNVNTLRMSASTGSAGSRMQRNRSTKQLHRIVEQPSPPQEWSDPSLKQDTVTSADVGSHVYSGEMLKESAQKVRQLCHHLELVSDAYRDMREQFHPLQEEYFRKLDECRFLEVQCRRLDTHCRLLEERAPNSSQGYMVRISSKEGLGVMSDSSGHMASSGSQRTLTSIAGSSAGSSAGQISFETKTFLSLAKQPGTKTAALQYLMSSTRNALKPVGESEPASSARQSPASKTPATSPARSASLGSLQGLGNVSGVTAVSLSAGSPLQSTLIPNVSHESLTGVPAQRPSAYGGAASARTAYRGQVGTGSSSSLHGSDVRERLGEITKGPTLVSASPVSMSSGQSVPTQPQSQPRSAVPAQAPGYAVRPAGPQLGGNFTAPSASRRQSSQNAVTPLKQSGQLQGLWPSQQ